MFFYDFQLGEGRSSMVLCNVFLLYWIYVRSSTVREKSYSTQAVLKDVVSEKFFQQQLTYLSSCEPRASLSELSVPDYHPLLGMWASSQCLFNMYPL